MNRNLFITLVVLIAILALGYPRVVRFFKSDNCLDQGGSWNYSSNNCRFSMGDENLIDGLSEVSWNTISENPEDFNGDTILISGKYTYIFENVRLSFGSNQIWVEGFDYDTIIVANFEERINGREVQIFGIFNSKDKGHLGQFLGTIEKSLYVTTK
ncbi:hypothetical protein [Ekhidna sp.]